MRSFLALSVFVLLAACASGPGRPEGGWVAVESGTIQFRDPYPTLIFDGDEISGSGGCNRYNGKIDDEDGVFSVKELAITEMACDPPVMEQETLFISLLQGAVSADQSQLGQLTLRSLDGRSLVFRSAAPQ